MQENINKMIALKQVTEMTGFSKSTVYAYMKIGYFPQAIKIGKRKVAWIEQEVSDWVMNKINNRI